MVQLCTKSIYIQLLSVITKQQYIKYQDVLNCSYIAANYEMLKAQLTINKQGIDNIYDHDLQYIYCVKHIINRLEQQK